MSLQAVLSNERQWHVETCDVLDGLRATGLVAKGLGLRYIGFELNPEYADMSRRRIARGLSEVVKQVESSAGQMQLFTEAST